MGTVDLDDDYCAGLAHRLGILVASVEYRLSPDFPYPVPLEDCYTGLRWLHDNATTLGLDPARIGIGGASWRRRRYAPGSACWRGTGRRRRSATSSSCSP